MTSRLIPALLAIALLIVAGYILQHEQARKTAQAPQVTLPTPPVDSTVLGAQTKTSGCQVNGPLPDPACTPGAVMSSATVEQICTPGYSSTVRNVPQALKQSVYAAYGITTRQPGQYEMDHLVSLELGGSNDQSNLFPEAADPRPGFHEKDQVENYLHDQLCSHKMTLPQVQTAIATNWLQVYNQLPH